jgi:hypothetical protein
MDGGSIANLPVEYQISAMQWYGVASPRGVDYQNRMLQIHPMNRFSRGFAESAYQTAHGYTLVTGPLQLGYILLTSPAETVEAFGASIENDPFGFAGSLAYTAVTARMFGNLRPCVSLQRRTAPTNGLREVGSRGIRNTAPLTAAQEAEIWQAVRDLGLNPGDVRILRTPSAYSEAFDVIMIGPDAFPAPPGATTRSVFERLTPRAVVAHEAGHMITTRAGSAFPGGTLLDEF